MPPTYNKNCFVMCPLINVIYHCIFTPRQKHSLTSLWHILLTACSVLNSTLSSSVYKRKCLHLWGRGGGEEWAVEQAEQDSQWKKETETLAICEFGLKPNHCPQSPCTCLTASFCNKVQLLLPATPTTGKKRNHRQNTRATKGKCLCRWFYSRVSSYTASCRKVWFQLTVSSSGQIYCQTRTMEHTSHLQNRNDLLCDETKTCWEGSAGVYERCLVSWIRTKKPYI